MFRCICMARGLDLSKIVYGCTHRALEVVVRHRNNTRPLWRPSKTFSLVFRSSKLSTTLIDEVAHIGREAKAICPTAFGFITGEKKSAILRSFDAGLQPLTQGAGVSGASLFMTADGCFVVKEVTKEEVKTLREALLPEMVTKKIKRQPISIANIYGCVTRLDGPCGSRNLI